MILEGKSWFVLAGRIPWNERDFGLELGFGIRPDAQAGEIRYRFFRSWSPSLPVRLVRHQRLNWPVPSRGWHCSSDWTGRQYELRYLAIEYGFGRRRHVRVLWRAR